MSEELIQYYIVNEDLVDKDNNLVKMSAGKLAAQVAHVATDIAVQAVNYINEGIHVPDDDWIELDKFIKWHRSKAHKKIILQAHEKVLNRVFEDESIWVARTIDFGYTELKPGQVTVVGLMPSYKSDLPSYIQRLQVYRG
jgi:peptidyl-tRNA hydrolase